MLSLIGSSASIPRPSPKFLNSCQIQFKRIIPIAKATNTLYMVSAAGKYRRKVFMLQPNAPNTEVLIKSSPYMTCSATHSTIPSKIPIATHPFGLYKRHYPFHFPSVKNGVIYAIIKPRLLRITQEIIIRFSHALDSSTVLPLLEKFIRSRATADVTTAAMLEIRRIWLYTSFIISIAFSQMVGAAKTGILKMKNIVVKTNPI